MNFLKLITSNEVKGLVNGTVNLISEMSSRAEPQKDKYPKLLDDRQVKIKEFKRHSEHWYTAEMKDGGYALIFEQGNWIAFYSPKLADLDVMKIFYNEFIEISMRDDCIPIIDKVVELIVQNPTRDPMYYATAAGLTGYVGKRMAQTNMKILNESLTEIDENPVHIAALHNQASTVKLLLREGVPPTKKTRSGKNIAHYGAKHLAVLETIKNTIPAAVFLELMKTEDNTKQSPLHIALEKSETMDFALNFIRQEQLENSPFSLPLISVIQNMTVNDEQYITTLCKKFFAIDPVFVSRTSSDKHETILHSALPTKILKILLHFCQSKHLEAQDAQGKTALHAAVIRSDYEAIIALISYGANVDALDKNGHSPIYYAVEKNVLKSVKALLLFNADVSKLDNAARASREIQTALGTGSKDYYGRERRSFEFDNRTIDHIALKQTVEQLNRMDLSDFYNAIAFDGGGMRGLVSLQILREIENRFTGSDFLNSFKTLGGTSTGSILILAIAQHGNLDKVMRMYLKLKDDIFCGSRPYNGEVLEKKLLDELGNVTLKQFGEQKNMNLAVTVTRVDVSPPKLAIFRSYGVEPDIKDERFTPLEKWTAAKIARCSSAAPTYFDSVDGKYMDGGIIANNPTCEILCDQQTLSLLSPYKKRHMKIMLSIGTGQPPQKNALDVNMSIPKNSFTGWVSSINSLVHMKNVFIDQLTSADGVNVDRAKLMSSAMNVAYFRFSPLLSEDYELDEVRAEKLIEMMWETKLYMNTRLNDINVLLSLLKK